MEKTIHDEMREKADLAFTYAEDGGFRSAARIFKEIMKEYEKRADEAFLNMQREQED